jgi:hypothetical protein
MASLVIQKILETRKITEYLDKKHIYPDDESNGKIKYRCPLHEGDNTPSFYVYTESGEYQNFYCFGCKANYNIIHLYRDLEKVSLGEAIRALASGLEIDINAELSSAIADIEADIVAVNDFSIADLTLMINRQLYDFLKMVENDPSCVEQADKMSQVVDKLLAKGDRNGLRLVNEQLSEVLTKRYVMYLAEQERRIMLGASSEE